MVAMLDSGDKLHQVGRIGVVNRRRARLGPELCRVPSERQNVADTKRRDSEQFALQTNKVFIPATHMQQRHDVVLLFEYCTDCQVTDPEDCERVISERNGVRTGVRQMPGSLEIAVQIKRLWSVQFCDDNGMAARD